MNSVVPRDPSPDVDWGNLGFNIIRTRSYIKYTYKNSTWSDGQLINIEKGNNNDPILPIHLASTGINYGQALFEGLKAVRMQDNKIRILRPNLHAHRLARSAKTTCMPSPSVEMFCDACRRVVADNADFVPPLSLSGAALYIRPVLIATGPQLGLTPSDEYVFYVFVNPVSSYYAASSNSTQLKPIKALIMDQLDRAAPFGTGHIKLAGNYVSGMLPTSYAKIKGGYTVLLFLDAQTRTYIEEFSTSNFVGLVHDETTNTTTYVTPCSKSILNSVTNRSLAELASAKFGWKVEKRTVLYDELRNGGFDEIAAVGTAVVIAPVNEVHRQKIRNVIMVKKDVNNGQLVRETIDLENDMDTTIFDVLADYVRIAKLKESGSTNNDEEVIIEDDLEVVKVPAKKNFEGVNKLFSTYQRILRGEEEDTLGWMWPKEGI